MKHLKDTTALTGKRIVRYAEMRDELDWLRYENEKLNRDFDTLLDVVIRIVKQLPKPINEKEWK